jgi:hypothetical protein
MLVRIRHTRTIVGVAVVSFSATILGGCGKKEEAPSAQGYYSGPMKPKSEATGGNKKTQAPSGSAAGEP